jgi:2-polyprenyl-3-methyl-5-hydroxy-6-metoxy-1,4-benzoquinol methylase
MTDFDYQWKNLLGKEALKDMEQMFECNNDRVKEFLGLTGIKPWYKKDSFIKDKTCLDAGCGPGRWTCAMQRLEAKKVDSFDLSEEAVKRCKKINPNAYVFDIWDLKPNPVYDFVLSWGVLHHTKNTREAFSKICSQVKKGGMLHIMVYNKENNWAYDGYRGDTCVSKHEEWEKLSFNEQIEMCKNKVKSSGGDVLGWFDAFNPKFNWSHSADEVRQWFEDEGFINIKLRMVKQNINMNGILK